MVKKLSQKIFLQTFKYVPRVAIDVLIKNKKGEILLTKRLSPPFVNFWHMPGSYLLRGETINGCIKRITKDELGIDLNGQDAELLGVFEDLDKDPRGHVIDIVYGTLVSSEIQLKPLGETKELNFFKQLPKKIGFNHRETLTRLGYK